MKIALITGANKGVGFAAARILARDHGFTVLIGARDEARGDEAAQELQNGGLDARFVQLDVTDDNSVREAARFIESEYGALDVLVNNAAVNLDKGRKLPQVTADEFRATFETNVLGPVHLTEEVWPLLLRAASPRVINVSSGAGRLYDMGNEMPAYSASKAALNAVTRQFAGLGAGKVSVNSVHPGWVKTDMGGREADLSPEEGAAIIVKLATIQAPPTGEFLETRGTIGW